jgi:hypothetical protein
MRTPDPAYRQALQTALARGPAGPAELATATGVPSRTLVRVLSELGDALVAGGQTRRRRYALRRQLRGENASFPIYQIDDAGKASPLAPLDLIRPQGSFCPMGPAWPCADEALDGWWDGLPYPLYDMRPQGYLGRIVAREVQEPLGVPANPQHWSDDDVVHFLARRGSDCSGNLIAGDASLRLHQASMLEPAQPLQERDLATAYAARADDAALQAVAGSSAGGEFPKFTVLREGPAGSLTPHVIVKFSGTADSVTTRRWGDLLVCEHLGVMHAGLVPGVQASTSRILSAGGRTFLESERFDRIGRHGRRALVSLQSANDHLLGLAKEDWSSYAEGLQRLGLLETAHVETIRRLWWFGRLIANTDMHLGNLGLLVQAGKFVPAPAFDMLPMRYAPLPGGEVPPAPQWTPPLPLPAEKQAWQDAWAPALSFWRAAAADARIESGLREVFTANAAKLERAAEVV